VSRSHYEKLIGLPLNPGECEVFYNRQRCHSATGYLAPLAYTYCMPLRCVT